MAQVDIQRTFHPVGQGAFYSEVFIGDDGNRLVMVYDCGSKTPKGEMEVSLDEQIEIFIKSLGDKKKIDLLVLSHFHEDHINGVKNLIENVKVKRTIIPMLTLPAVTITRVHNYLYDEYDEKVGDVDEIIRELYLDKDPTGRFGEVFVVAWGDEIAAVEGAPKAPYPQRLGNGRIIPNGQVQRSLNFPFWEYVPFNSIDINDQRAIDFMDEIRQIPGAMNGDRLNVDGLIRGYRTKVRNLYKKVMKGENDNLYTLVMESRPVENINPVPDKRLSRCLYMGDFDWKGDDMRWNRFKRVFSIKDIGTIQVPHHGSKENWHEDLLSGKERAYVISAGTMNTYHHPDFWVVKSMWDKGHGVSVVSEKKASKGEWSFFVVI